MELEKNDNSYKVIKVTPVNTSDQDYNFHVMSKEETDKYLKSLQKNESANQIKIYGENQGDKPMLVAYATTDEMADDLINDFKDSFDRVWKEE